MSYEWQNEYEPGQVKMVCGICGGPYRFPSELTYCDDKVMRCKRTCMETTVLARDRKIAASHGRREAVPPPFGTKASWDTATTPTLDCTGGIMNATRNTIYLPAALVDQSITWRTLTISGCGDPTDDGAYVISAVLDQHTLKVPLVINDLNPMASATVATVS